MNTNFLSLTLFFLTMIINAQTPINNKTNIDLSHWKVTMPYGSPEPVEVDGTALINFNSDSQMNKFMYLDSIDRGLVFYAKSGTKTRNTSYARCELREQLVLGKDDRNWTFEEGGRMKGTLKVDAINKNKKRKWYKVVIM